DAHRAHARTVAYERIAERDDVALVDGRLRHGERQVDPEMRTLARLAVETDAPAQLFGEGLGDGGAQAGAAEAAAAAAVGLFEGLEDPLLRRLCDADAGIAYGK